MIALAVALALTPLLAAPVGAAPPSAAGWWWRAQTGLVAAVPPPPNVPAGGLMVAGAPDGATAVSALRFELAEGEGSPVLTLRVADDVGGATAEMAACPTGAPWSPALAGTWDEKPTAACSRGSVQGVRSEDGATWTFALAPLLVGTVLDVVVVPAERSVFQLAFDPPSQDALATAEGAAPSPAAEDSPALAPRPETSSARAGDVVPFTPALPAADQVVTAVAPGVSPPPTAAPAPPTPSAPRARPADRPRTARGFALAVLALALVAGVVAVVRGGVTPIAIRNGGVGRFARPRAGSPPPIV